MTNTPENSDPFIHTMQLAQEGHSSQLYATAASHWRQAVDMASRPSERAQALRGLAGSLWRASDGNFSNALAFAQEAQAIHADLSGPLGAPTAPAEAVRERVESDRVVGRMLFKRGVTLELAGDQKAAEQHYQQALPSFGTAFIALRDLRRQTHGIDQYEINVLPDIAIAKSLARRTYAPELTGVSGLGLALRAARLAPLSERPWGPTSARMGVRYEARAVARSSARAGAAVAIGIMATKKSSPRRTTSLHLAAKVL